MLESSTCIQLVRPVEPGTKKQATHTATSADVDPKEHRVLVDAGGQVKLCSITQYEQSTSPEVCHESNDD
jgi:hypothetical protein